MTKKKTSSSNGGKSRADRFIEKGSDVQKYIDVSKPKKTPKKK